MEIKSLLRISLLLIALILPGISKAETSGYLQIIQIVNYLSNTSITNSGMTPTSVNLEFFEETSTKPCWTTMLAYQTDFTIHSGAGQNCSKPITTITVTPIMVASLLQTYTGPYTITVDTTKYALQMTILQDTAPIFDTASGLVATPGTIKAQVQGQQA